MRKDFSRSQSQSAEDGDLARAEPLFNFSNNSWILPSSESQYREGIAALNRYEARLSDPNSKLRCSMRALTTSATGWATSTPVWVRCRSVFRPALAV